jgi:hypothetical protein
MPRVLLLDPEMRSVLVAKLRFAALHMVPVHQSVPVARSSPIEVSATSDLSAVRSVPAVPVVSIRHVLPVQTDDAAARNRCDPVHRPVRPVVWSIPCRIHPPVVLWSSGCSSSNARLVYCCSNAA